MQIRHQQNWKKKKKKKERKIQIQWLNISWTSVCLSENIAYVLNVWPLKWYLTSYNSIYLQKKKFIEEAAMFSEHKVTLIEWVRKSMWLKNKTYRCFEKIIILDYITVADTIKKNFSGISFLFKFNKPASIVLKLPKRILRIFMQ